MKDLTCKIAQFFSGEDFAEHGDDAKLELTANELRKIVDIIYENQKFQPNYEARLKADLEAILVELQLEIEEKEYLDGEEPINITQDYIDEVKSWEYGKKDCYKIIQQKIDKLKGVEE